MAGLHALTVVLEICWTLWLVVALWSLGRRRGGARWVLLAGFFAIALALAFTVGVSWRVYIMAWLGAHVALASLAIVSEVKGRRVQVTTAAVSLAGLTVLWATGGASQWRDVVWAASCVACAGAGFAFCWMTAFRAERQKTETLNTRIVHANDMHQLERRNARTANMSLQATEEARRLAVQGRQAAEDELTILRTGYEHLRREAEALRLELHQLPRQRTVHSEPVAGPDAAPVLEGDGAPGQ